MSFVGSFGLLNFWHRQLGVLVEDGRFQVVVGRLGRGFGHLGAGLGAEDALVRPNDLLARAFVRLYVVHRRLERLAHSCA